MAGINERRAAEERALEEQGFSVEPQWPETFEVTPAPGKCKRWSAKLGGDEDLRRWAESLTPPRNAGKVFAPRPQWFKKNKKPAKPKLKAVR